MMQNVVNSFMFTKPQASQVTASEAFQKIADKFSPCKVFANLGYSVTCPAGWVEYNANDKTAIFNSPATMKTLRQVEAGTIYSEGYENDVNINFYDSVADYPNNDGKLKTLAELVADKNQSMSDVKAITFAGSKAYSATIGGMGAYYTILVEHNGHLYEIFFGNREKLSDLNADENAFLKSFKFTN